MLGGDYPQIAVAGMQLYGTDFESMFDHQNVTVIVNVRRRLSSNGCCWFCDYADALLLMHWGPDFESSCINVPLNVCNCLIGTQQVNRAYPQLTVAVTVCC